jgi:5-methylcytosine-specific restriction protein A
MCCVAKIASPTRLCPPCLRARDAARGTSTERGLGWSYQKKRPHILARDGGVCWICGGLGADSVDHVVPRARGGGNGDENLRAAHLSCNSARK